MKFRGMKVLYKKGYPAVYWPNHMLSYEDGTVYIHRVVANDLFGPLSSDDHVHHINEDILDWSVGNLKILTNREHARLHNPRNRKTVICSTCERKFDRVPSKVKEDNYCSRRCGPRKEKIKWPSTLELLFMVEESSYVATGKHLGVSDNAVRKRIKNHSLGYIPSVL